MRTLPRSIRIAAMSETSTKKRKHSTPTDSSSKRSRRTTANSNINGAHYSPAPLEQLHILQLESEVRELGARVLAFRDKGLQFFARLSEERVRAYALQEGTTYTGATESKNGHEDLWRALKERLAVANKTLPTLLKELAMWNSKIQQAVDVKRKGQQLVLLDKETPKI